MNGCDFCVVVVLCCLPAYCLVGFVYSGDFGFYVGCAVGFCFTGFPFCAFRLVPCGFYVKVFDLCGFCCYVLADYYLLLGLGTMMFGVEFMVFELSGL